MRQGGLEVNIELKDFTKGNSQASDFLYKVNLDFAFLHSFLFTELTEILETFKRATAEITQIGSRLQTKNGADFQLFYLEGTFRLNIVRY